MVFSFAVGAAQWADASSLAGTQVGDAVREVVSTLGATTPADDGAEKVGAEPHTSPNGFGFATVSAGSLRTQLNNIIDNAAHLFNANTFASAQTFDGANVFTNFNTFSSSREASLISSMLYCGRC